MINWRRFIHILMLFSVCSVQAQYYVPDVKNDAFSRKILEVINDVPANFETVKGKALKTQGAFKRYRCKVNIKGWKDAVIEERPNEVTCRFILESYEQEEQAADLMESVTEKIHQSMSQRTLILKNDSIYDNKDNVIRQNRIAYLVHTGFYQYNIFVETLKKADDKYGVQVRIRGGTPRFFCWIPKNEPMGSPVFAASFKKNAEVFSLNELRECMIEIPGYTCSSALDSMMNRIIQYDKFLQDLPNAFYEYRYAVGNIKACLNDGYLVSQLKGGKDTLRKAEFIKASDVEKTKRRHILVSLIRVNNNLVKLNIAFKPEEY